VFGVQLKLQSGPRLDEVNDKKKEFTVLWEGFKEKVCSTHSYQFNSIAMSTAVMLYTISYRNHNGVSLWRVL